MRLEFKQAVCFHGKDYSKGVHDVPEAVLKDKFFHKMLLAGLIAEPHVTHEVSKKKMKELAEALLSQKSEEAPPADAPPSDEDFSQENPDAELEDAPPSEEEQIDDESEHKESSGKKKKHKR